MELVDAAVGRIAHAIQVARIKTPSIPRLTASRSLAAERVYRAVEAQARELHPGLEQGCPQARRALAALAEEALACMRAEADEEARRSGALGAIATRLDARFRDTRGREWLDDPDFDRDARVRVLEHLDRFNRTAGSYRAFFEAMRPFLRRDGRPTRVLDLAAGHGGFALAAARIARHEEIPLEIVATDLKREYLELGEAVAERESLPVRFAVQDALDLGNLRAGDHDVVVCTQSLHHFPPGMVAVLASEASRVATGGVVLIDGYRSRSHAVTVGALGLLRYRDLAFAHDAWVSFRRFFTPEELGLLARLGPHGNRVEAAWAPPAHCRVTIDRRPERA